ncbi:MAG: hypothetical protein ROZ65_04325 [Pseudomonadaceae bacterium]|nr:hypothetical protein [Pseudomonadaceae bacterium]
MIQLLKSVSIKSFVSTEAAHFTAAFLTVKLFFENLFSTQPLAAPINLYLSSAGGESYSVQNRCQPPLSPLPINPTEATNRTQPPPCQPGAFYSNPPPAQPSISKQLVDLQEILEEDRARSGAHYRGLKVCVNRYLDISLSSQRCRIKPASSR